MIAAINPITILTTTSFMPYATASLSTAPYFVRMMRISGLSLVQTCKILAMRQTIPAHFDGQHILLDEPLELEPNTKLLVTVSSGVTQNRPYRVTSKPAIEK